MWNMLKPFFEIALLIPPPLRYSFYMFCGLIFVRILPVRALITLLGMGLALLLRGAAYSIDMMSRVYVNRNRDSRALDSIDHVVQLLLQSIERVSVWLAPRLKPSWRGVSLPKSAYISLLLLPIGFWISSIALSETIVGRALIGGFWQTHRIEQRAMMGFWPPSEQPTVISLASSPTMLPETNVPPNEMSPPTTLPEARFETYIVRKGDILRGIAEKYNIKTSCLRDINQQHDPKFNPDSLRIGAELLIPIDDPSCTR